MKIPLIILAVLSSSLCLAAAAASLASTSSTYREDILRWDAGIFPLLNPSSPWVDTLSTHDLVSRFAVAAGRVFLERACEEVAQENEVAQQSPTIRRVCHVHRDSKSLAAFLSADVVTALIGESRSRNTASSSVQEEPPYFQFIPQYLGGVRPSGEIIVLLPTSSCNTTMSVSAQLDNATSVMSVVVESYRQSNVTCVDDLLLSVGPSSAALRVTGTGRFTATMSVSLVTSALHWLAQDVGVRIFEFHQSDPEVRVVEVIETLLLFLPLLTGHLDPMSAASNVEFLTNYSLMLPYPVPRSFPSVVNVSTLQDIHSGDLFAKMALDGLGPVESFAQGTTSGHTAIAMRNETTGELFVCESVEQGIICTPYEQWIQEMQSAGANIVLAPLDSVHREAFNVTQAWSHVNDFVGNAYGYFNFFFGWVDTDELNYPCLPSGFRRCLSYEIIEYVMLFLDNVVPEITSVFFGQALNHRAQTGSLSMPIAEVLYHAFTTLGISPKQLMTVPENDAWLYNSTKKGVSGHVLLPSQVCSSFACSTLRAGGAFNEISDNLTCTEIDVWDIFSFKMFDAKKMGINRPLPCQAADPGNELCQLSGTWTFHLVQDFNSREVVPQMSLHCASRNPSPYNHEGC